MLVTRNDPARRATWSRALAAELAAAAGSISTVGRDARNRAAITDAIVEWSTETDPLEVWAPGGPHRWDDLNAWCGRYARAGRLLIGIDPTAASDALEGYGLPSFRYMALLVSDVRSSEHGTRYASPPLMALANLLSHDALGKDVIGEPIAGREIRRSAKDLGRVLALAHLHGDVEEWLPIWATALISDGGYRAATEARRRSLPALTGGEQARRRRGSMTGAQAQRPSRPSVRSPRPNWSG